MSTKFNTLSNIGVVSSTDLEEVRVSVVQDTDNGRKFVAYQVWWREDPNQKFKVGRGLFLSLKRVDAIASVINKLTISGFDGQSTTLQLTNTQRYVVSRTENSIRVQKEWRRDDSSGWELTKSISIPKEKSISLLRMLDEASSLLAETLKTER